MGLNQPENCGGGRKNAERTWGQNSKSLADVRASAAAGQRELAQPSAQQAHLGHCPNWAALQQRPQLPWRRWRCGLREKPLQQQRFGIDQGAFEVPRCWLRSCLGAGAAWRRDCRMTATAWTRFIEGGSDRWDPQDRRLKQNHRSEAVILAARTTRAARSPLSHAGLQPGQQISESPDRTGLGFPACRCGHHPMTLGDGRGQIGNKGGALKQRKGMPRIRRAFSKRIAAGLHGLSSLDPKFAQSRATLPH